MDHSMNADLSRWRAETPGCERIVHLNNAGAALVTGRVQAAVLGHLALEQEIGGYEAADAQAESLESTYAAVGRLLGAQARNIAIVQNSTVAFAQAMSAFDFGTGDIVLTTRADYASNQIMYLSLARRRGVEILRAPDAAEGGVDADEVRRLIRRRRPALVSLTWIPTNSGLVQPAEEVGRICREAEVPYLVDGCQAVGQMPVDVRKLNCDYFAAATRKFLRGPRGLGFLYASDRVLRAGAYPLLIDMHGATWTDADDFALTPDARRFESWEFAYALVLGLGAAADYAMEVGLETARDRARELADYARSTLAVIPGVRVLDRGPELCAIVTAAIAGWDAAEIKLRLRAQGINTSSPHREDAVIDMDDKQTASALRISPHYYNTREEIDTAAEALREAIGAKVPAPATRFPP
jgi:selenocysteine lyase/cysteine desulfurase